MRKVVMRMMTTLNGRLDDPDAWVTGVPDDLYAELDRLYETFDTILVGRTTYEEMFAYWRQPLLRAPRRVIHVARAQTSELERPA